MIEISTAQLQSLNNITDSQRIPSWSSDSNSAEILTLENQRLHMAAQGLMSWTSEDITVRVPTDFGTMQEAFAYLSRIVPISNGANSPTFIIEIEDDYVVPNTTLDPGDGRPAALLATAGSWNHILVRQTNNNTITVANDFQGSLFRNIHCDGITLAATFDMSNASKVDGNDYGLGYSIEGGGKGFVLGGFGILNAPGRCLFVRQNSELFAGNAGSRFQADYATAPGSVFTGAGEEGIYVNHTARAYIRDCDFSNATLTGIAGSHSVTIDCENAISNNCGQNGISIDEASTINARGVQANNNQVYGIVATEACVVNAEGCTFTGSGNNGIEFSDSIISNLRDTVCTGNTGRGLSLSGGCFVNARDMDLRNNTNVSIRNRASICSIRDVLTDGDEESDLGGMFIGVAA